MDPRRMLARLLIGAGSCAAALGGGVASGGAAGDPEAGQQVFTAKQCVRCHPAEGREGVGPALATLRRPQGGMELAGRLWNHVPGMFATLAREGLEWPRINAREMADLMVYLRADPARDPEPDPDKGQVMLLRKGCLKCHPLKREGGQVEPDLAAPRSDYESAAAWAATMWAHAPRMLGLAGRRNIPYPRFSGDEMGHLVGFLRHAAAGPGARRTAPGR